MLARMNNVDNAADNPAWKIFTSFPLTSRSMRLPGTTRAPTRAALVLGARLGLRPDRRQSGEPGRSLDALGPDGSGRPVDVHDAREQSELTRAVVTASNNPPRPAGTLFQPTSATRDYVYPWTNVWFTSKCDPANLVDPATGSRGPEPGDISAAVTNLFAMHNALHDFAYYLGFTEAAWNGQQNNFGTPPPFLGNDPVTGNAQAGGITGGFPGFARPRQREHEHPARRDTVRDEHVPLAADRRLVLRPVRRRRLRHVRDRPRVRPHDREPHDRKGLPPQRRPRRRDGRGVRRSERDAVPEREPRRPGQRDQSVRRGCRT